MNKLRSTRRARLTGFLLAVLCVLTSLGPAEAATVNNARIVGSYCSGPGGNGMDWRGTFAGQSPPSSDTAAFGRTKFCQTMYKIQDGDSAYDYYAVVLAVTFVQDGNPMYKGGKATVTLQSSAASQQGVYHSSPATTTFSQCAQLGISFSWTLVSGTLPINVCSSSTLTRSGFSGTGATWSVDNVSRLKSFEAIFYQKVNAGVSPRYSGRITWPYYTRNKPDANHSLWWFEENYGSSTWSIQRS